MKPLTLTDKFCDSPTRRPGTYLDRKVRGLEFRVRDSGAKSWSIRYRLRGTQTRFTLGPYPALKLAEARDRAKDAIRDVEDGIDPRVEKQARREADTVEQLAKSYIELHAKPKKRSWQEDDRILRADVLPHWKDRLARDITRRDVRELVESIAARGAPVLANRVVALLSKMFTFALDREMVDTSPAVRITRPGAEQSRERVLTDDELRTFWIATEALAPAMRAFYRLRLLTAQRGIEVGTMTWADVDLAAGWWTIPASIAKNGLSHRVPLTPIVVELLTALPRDTTYVLDGARGKRQQREAAATFGIADFRGHDLRRTAASRMTAAGIPRLHVGRVLNHAETGVTAVYDRHSYDAEKRIALDTLARTINAVVTGKPGGVLPFVRPGHTSARDGAEAPVVYSFGYGREVTSARFVARVAELGATVIDTRLKPFSRTPEWNRTTLSKALGDHYKWVEALGNHNYKGGRVDIVDLEAGLQVVEQQLTQGPVVLLCVCTEERACHRAVVLDALQARGCAVVPWEAMRGRRTKARP